MVRQGSIGARAMRKRTVAAPTHSPPADLVCAARGTVPRVSSSYCTIISCFLRACVVEYSTKRKWLFEYVCPEQLTVYALRRWRWKVGLVMESVQDIDFLGLVLL